MNWEVLSDNRNSHGHGDVTMRAKVPGGWLYKAVSTRDGAQVRGVSTSLCFVPDPNTGGDQ